MELYEHQIDAYQHLKNGCILNGGVGTGKSRVALTYYFFKVVKGTIQINLEGRFTKPKKNVPLYIITTARKRDTKEWESEMIPFLLSIDISKSVNHIPVVIDSWNNIQKYVGIENGFFIFDEQRVVGKGAWSKSFIKIAKNNQWILLSATPGDTWSDYIPVFIANGFYKNRTDFSNQHIIYSRFTKYPKVDRYVNTKKLENERTCQLLDI